MAPAPAPQAPQRKNAAAAKRAPAQALEVIFFLERAEAAVLAAAKSGSLHGAGCGSDDESQLEEEVWQAKIRAYERTLRERLERWDTLGEGAAERLRSRIEDLGPSLAAAFARRRVALAPTQAPQPAASPPSSATAPLARIIAPSARAVTGDAGALAAAVEEKEEDAGMRRRGGAVAEASEGRGPSSQRAELMAGRKPGVGAGRGGSTAGMNGARGQLEDEMADLSEGMKGVANSFLKTLQKDNKRLEQVSEEQQRNLDRVKAENEKGRQLMRRGQLGFLCTMIMVATTVVIFFMMIPFIVVT